MGRMGRGGGSVRAEPEHTTAWFHYCYSAFFKENPWSEVQLMYFVYMKTKSELVGFVLPEKQANDLLRKP